MASQPFTTFAPPSQIFMPVQADGCLVRDNGGDVIASCFTPAMAETVVRLLNRDAGVPYA